MKNNENVVNKLSNGSYNLTVKQNRLDLLKALFSGKITINLDKDQAKILSKELYVPVKRTYKPAAEKQLHKQ